MIALDVLRQDIEKLKYVYQKSRSRYTIISDIHYADVQSTLIATSEREALHIARLENTLVLPIYTHKPTRVTKARCA